MVDGQLCLVHVRFPQGSEALHTGFKRQNPQEKDEQDETVFLYYGFE